MAEPRGSTGAVSGLPPEQVRGILVPIARTILKKDRGRFTRVDLKALVVDRTGLAEEVAENLVTAFLRCSGAFRVDHGHYQLPRDAVRYTQDRDWRLHVGRIGAADAAALLGILEESERSLTPRLVEILMRLRTAAAALQLNPVPPAARREEWREV